MMLLPLLLFLRISNVSASTSSGGPLLEALTSVTLTSGASAEEAGLVLEEDGSCLLYTSDAADE